MKDYSEKEIKLFTFFGYGDILDHLIAPVIYRMCVEKAFIDNMIGPEVDSLRRCVKSLYNCKVYRMTPEWDSMIEFS